MSRKIIIKTYKEAEVSVEELYKLERAAFQQWIDAGLYTVVAHTPIEQFMRYITEKVDNWGRFSASRVWRCNLLIH